MSPYQQKRKLEQQIKSLQDKILKINDRAELDRGLRLFRLLARSGASFGVTEANAFSVYGSVHWGTASIDPKLEKAIMKLLGWTGYHESFYVSLPSRQPKSPHLFSFRVDDSRYSFSLSFRRPQAGKLERQMTEEEKNDTFFARYLARLCRRRGIKIDLGLFERALEKAQGDANEKRANLERMRRAVS